MKPSYVNNSNNHLIILKECKNEQVEPIEHEKVKKVSKEAISSQEENISEISSSSLKGRVSESNIQSPNLDVEFMNFRLALSVMLSVKEQWDKSNDFKSFINAQDLSQMPEEKVFELTALLYQGAIQHPNVFDEEFISSKLPESAKQYYDVLKDLEKNSISLKEAYKKIEKTSKNQTSLYAQAAQIINIRSVPIRKLRDHEGWKDLDIPSLVPHLRYFDVRDMDKDSLAIVFKYPKNIQSLLINNADIKELPSLPNCQLIRCESLSVKSLPDLPQCQKFKCHQCPFLESLPKLPNCIEFKLSMCKKIKIISDLLSCVIFVCNNCPDLTSISDLKNCGYYACEECPKLTFPPKLNKDLAFVSIISKKQPIEFEKGKAKIGDFISIDKTNIIGKGTDTIVYSHKDNPDIAIKKTQKTTKNLSNEYYIGYKIDHPNVTKSYALYIKKYPDEKNYMKNYLELYRIKGVPIANFFEQPTKLPHQVIQNLIKEAKDCCLYFYDNNIVWDDIHGENVFIENNHLKLIDFGRWKVEENVNRRTQSLHARALTLFRLILESSTISDEKKSNIRREDEIYAAAKAKFGEYPILKMPTEETKTFLSNYFDNVLAKFNKCIEEEEKT